MRVAEPLVWPLGRRKGEAFLRESAFSLRESTNFYGICHFSLLFNPYNVSVNPLGAASHPRQTVAGQSQSQPRL